VFHTCSSVDKGVQSVEHVTGHFWKDDKKILNSLEIVIVRHCKIIRQLSFA